MYLGRCEYDIDHLEAALVYRVRKVWRLVRIKLIHHVIHLNYSIIHYQKLMMLLLHNPTSSEKSHFL